MERALSLKEAAEVLGVSYYTVYSKRFELAFRLPGSRIWRVWPSTLQNLRSGVNLDSLSVRGLEKSCQSISTRNRRIGTSDSQHQAAKELNDLLEHRIAKPLKSITIA